MIFYHGTSKENWEAIQREGILYGRRYILGENCFPLKEVDRCTYLAVDLGEAKYYGDVVLRKNALMNYFHKRVEELNSPLNGVFGSTEREHCNERISELLLLIDKLNSM